VAYEININFFIKWGQESISLPGSLLEGQIPGVNKTS